ncbi:TetR/AcrR family transcriptional regulator [Fictibacillus aquaticus]|uniref:TetR family transcriptional regulator n=1 Tax=Fictibacillus aquaticus TaxID=2021314 RepID=A0A235F5S8_9BACL|nr:TetR/AcrR family transcriptional regulator [Fictibacillus aquaticus]OYD56656.1 TetR family transcriptional regulator [Fictibacillus aquaticus]
MFSKFLSLDEAKQKRILNAAIKMYVQKGYDLASTNEIVKEAGISKGLLFHYFQNKKMLYLFVFDHCMELVMNDFYKKVDMQIPDFFERLREITRVKMELLNMYPNIFRFFEKAYLEDASDVRAEFQEKLKKFSESSSDQLFANLDISKFKDGLDIQKAIKSVIWTFEGFSAEVLAKAKAMQLDKPDYNEAFREADDYIEMFRGSFYK